MRRNGWILLRQSRGSHELWGLPDGSVMEVVPHHQVSAGIVRRLISKLDEVPEGWR
ncbi:MAG: type II toxin-antitoxin system HicA family toxin [Bifidobacteriaceae bacterium]|nr:type II toxin-antitoxin system HicA family toxin [Bifidobacteriaceae bacterium]